MSENETAAARVTGTTARENPDRPAKVSQDASPLKSKADVLRERIRGVRSARRLIGEAKAIARWRTDFEAFFALVRASDFLGRERAKLESELAREEDR